jgi:hypothetical protein
MVIVIELQWMECSPVTFPPKTVSTTKNSGVDEQSVHLEIKCHLAHPRMLCWLDVPWMSKHYSDLPSLGVSSTAPNFSYIKLDLAESAWTVPA